MPTPTTRTLPATGHKPHRARITDAQFMTAPTGDVGLFLTLEVVKPRAYAGTPLVHMIPILLAGSPMSILTASVELLKLGLTAQECMQGDVPALLRGRVVEFNYRPDNPRAGQTEEITILRLATPVH